MDTKSKMSAACVVSNTTRTSVYNLYLLSLFFVSLP